MQFDDIHTPPTLEGRVSKHALQKTSNPIATGYNVVDQN
jgi:hypothetical protein